MPSPLHERLMEAKQRLRTKAKLDAMRHEASRLLAEERERCRLHQRTLDAEKADVERLEGFGLSRLFYSLLGTQAEKVEEERQEYLAAKLKHDESLAAIAELESEVQRLGDRLDSFVDASETYTRLLEEKQAWLLETADPRAERLMQLSERIGELESEREELQEAIATGQQALRALDEVCSQLQSAKDWGTWDMLGGGGVTTWIKHGKIDDARQQARIAQHRLRTFQAELADAEQRLRISLEDIGGLATFADYFFDGLIADWIVQSKIANAHDAAERAMRKVREAIAVCRAQLRQVEDDRAQGMLDRQHLIETAG